MSAHTLGRRPLQRLTTAADRALAHRYAVDMVNAADDSPLDRQALVLAAAQLATMEGHPDIAQRYLRTMSAPPKLPWRERLARGES